MKNNKSSQHSLSRRNFLKRSALGSLGGSSLFSMMSQFNMANAQVSEVDDYKALVCVFLYGGNDSFNMLVPHSQTEYDAYASTRLSLAVPRENLLPLSPLNSMPADYGLHPELSDLAARFADGKLSFIANVGALIEPTTQDDYVNNRVQLPPQLFSHNDQQNFVMSLQASKPQQGWASRIADAMLDVNTNDSLSMNISLTGVNTLQAGGIITPYHMSSAGVRDYWSIRPESTEDWDINRYAAYRALLDQPQSHLFASQYANTQSRSIELGLEVGAALEASSTVTTIFDESSRLASSLRMVANLVSAREALGMKRQIFFIGIGDYDTHGDQANRYPLLMEELNHSLNSFYDATVELGLSDKITTFTASDFGRTLTSNGDGTDHGWGGHQLIMGDAIDGGKIFGTMPELVIGSNDDIGEGRIIPTTSVDQYVSTLSSWYGLNPTQISELFPNLANFNEANLGLFTG